MSMTGILLAALIVGGTGLFIGVFLGISGKKFAVETDERWEAVLDALPGNNCGGCGYDTCRQLAEALLNGDAEPSMCVSYMRKLAIRKASAMLRSMPSAIVMADADLKIIETNEAFVRMFAPDLMEIFKDRPEGLAGGALDRVVPFVDLFKRTLNSGKDIHKERYPIGKNLFDIAVFEIERNKIVGAVITDVTQTEMKREQIARKAHEVIEKNIATVQNIACLLGEHMVDTELLLSQIAQGYEETSENNEENSENGGK